MCTPTTGVETDSHPPPTSGTGGSGAAASRRNTTTATRVQALQGDLGPPAEHSWSWLTPEDLVLLTFRR